MSDLASRSGNSYSCLLSPLSEQLEGETRQAEDRYWVIMGRGEREKMTGAGLLECHGEALEGNKSSL